MNRDSLNVHLDGFLSLADDNIKARYLLIEEGIDATSIRELLNEWLIIHDIGVDQVLRLKLWFGASYADLADIFDLSTSEVAQTLRAQRVALLPSYPPVQKAMESEQIAGLSCFMVEQYLSPWLDSEIQDLRILNSIRSHLDQCHDCHLRLEAYRNLQSLVLRQRRTFVPISPEEWKETVEGVRRQSRHRILRTGTYVFLTLALCTFLAWVIWSKPEKMPNIYEIDESSS